MEQSGIKGTVLISLDCFLMSVVVSMEVQLDNASWQCM